MARIYYFPKVGSAKSDILQVATFLREYGHSVEVPSEGEELFSANLDAPLADQPTRFPNDQDGHALFGWHRKTMDWADTLLVATPHTCSAMLTAGYFAAQGKRSVLLHTKLPMTTGQMLFTDGARTMEDVIDLICPEGNP